MHITEYGAEHAQTLLFLPCTAEPVWAFSAAVTLLARRWHVFQVSYDGHEPAYPGDFLSVEQTVAEITLWLRSRGITRLDAAYGCSLGGSVVSLLVSRQNIHIDHAIIGSSDMDQAPKWLAKLETALVMPIFYPLITGQGGGLMKKVFEKKMNNGQDSTDYMQRFMELMGQGSGVDFSFISKESMKNQFCTDLYTKVGEHIRVPGTTIHVFYALKMGEKYRARYLKYFADPDICEYDLQHEELLLDADRWVDAVVQACQRVK